jgi:SAM-dependent methyltransferase
MSSLLIKAQIGFLRTIAPPVPKEMITRYDGKSKISILLGPEFLPGVRGLHVVDFGCGNGLEVIELAKAGAARVTGVDIGDVLVTARKNIESAGLADRCAITSNAAGIEADAVLSLDSFEHYADPEEILQVILKILRPGGLLHVSFGPIWYHPTGSHLAELPPWSHVVFSEQAVLGWRSLMRGPGAKSYEDLGLNRMTISRFEQIVARSPFQVEAMRVVPIRKLRWLHNKWTREFTTATVRCTLRKPGP